MNIALQNWGKNYWSLARLDQPIGGWLLLFPCWWGLSLAGLKIATHPWLFFVMFVGAFSLRSAGCVFNDYIDRHVDRLVERTKNRPLAAGTIAPRSGLLFFAILCLPGLWVLTQLSHQCIILTPLGMVLLMAYPLAKKITHWPQAVLGMAFSHGILFGFSAIRPLTLDVVPLYLATVLWVIAYDTVYALQDRDDDVKVGVKSTAILFGSHAKLIVSGFYLASFGLMALSSFLMKTGTLWFYGVLILTSIMTIISLLQWNPDNQADCKAKFQANQWIGWLVTLALQ